MTTTPIPVASEQTIYTAITFAPVQGFIENSRKLRDLYGSSYILSYLARAVCEAVPPELSLISPAITNITQGTPNQILIKGDLRQQTAQDTFNKAWKIILKECQAWIEETVTHQWQWNSAISTYDQTTTPWDYSWDREWKLCANNAWEFFWAQGSTAHEARDNLFQKKRSRNWIAINWTGESSTLSGADALALPSAGTYHPKQGSLKDQEAESKAFFAQLSAAIGKAFIDNIREQLRTDKLNAIARYGPGFIHFVERTSNNEAQQKELYQTYGAAILDPTEQLSIPELVKRLITLEAIAQNLDIPLNEVPETYRDLNRLPQKQKDPTKRRWTGWFLGDGDRASEYLSTCPDSKITEFSEEMLKWGETLKSNFNKNLGRIIYAGGDDFLGVFYRKANDATETVEFINPVLQPYECLEWFYGFRSDGNPPDLWDQKKITVSVGFVWAAPNVPQRDVLQHCREAEKVAKNSGRDRIAIRILFNGGNTLEWTCPWWFLRVFQDYRDRNYDEQHNPKKGAEANWNHIFQDIATLEARHAFEGNTEVAIALFELYFCKDKANPLRDPNQHWNHDGQAGILGDGDRFPTPQSKQKALNDWVINLAKVGFHLHREQTEATDANEAGDRNNAELRAA
jgi:CRISPR-associated protein Cmr2